MGRRIIPYEEVSIHLAKGNYLKNREYCDKWVICSLSELEAVRFGDPSAYGKDINDFDRNIDITQKQLKFICDIQKYVEPRFNGRTKKEASEYIKNNIDEFYQLKKIESISQSWNKCSKKYSDYESAYSITGDPHGIVDCFDMGIYPWGDS